MDKLTPQDPLDLDRSNISDAWRKWKQLFDLFSLASLKEEGTQAATLVGPDALEVYNTFSWEDTADKTKVAKILEKLEVYCVPQRNISWEILATSATKKQLISTSRPKPRHVSSKILRKA